MLTPMKPVGGSFLFKTSSIPAASLTRGLPNDQDASILCLSGGDLRNILHTAYIEAGLSNRTLDITLCDVYEKAAARNILLLSFLLEAEVEATDEELDAIYYRFGVTSSVTDILLKQTNKVLAASQTLDDWDKSDYGRVIKFCDSDTLQDVRDVWGRIKDAAEKSTTDRDYATVFRERLQPSRDISKKSSRNSEQNLNALRSIDPLSAYGAKDLPLVSEQFWQNAMDEKLIPNPVFASLLTEKNLLHYTYDPILGYHLAEAYAPLVESSSSSKTADLQESTPPEATAKAQFSTWSRAFRTVAAKRFVLRFSTAETLAFCHSLQNLRVTEDSANLYRRPWDPRILKFDDAAYGPGPGHSISAPTVFDTIDASNLAGSLGVLNIVIAASPLLKNEPWASLFTDQFANPEISQQQAFEDALCGDPQTVMLLLGISPVSYWTNSKCEAQESESLIALSRQDPEAEIAQVYNRLSWIRNGQIQGQSAGEAVVHFESKSLARVFFELGKRMLQRAQKSYYHPGSLAALIKVAMSRLHTDAESVYSELLCMINLDESSAFSSYFNELMTQMHIMSIHTYSEIREDMELVTSLHKLKTWHDTPPVVAVSLVIPRTKLAEVCEGPYDLTSSFLIGLLATQEQKPHIFHDIHCLFGHIKTSSSAESNDFEISIDQEPRGNSGEAPLIVSWYIPTAAFRDVSENDLITLGMVSNVSSTTSETDGIDSMRTVFQARLGDSSLVYLTKFMPGQSAYPVICAATVGARSSGIVGEELKQDFRIQFDIPEGKTKLNTFTGHIDITDQDDLGMLRSNAPIEIHQENPFILSIMLGTQNRAYPVTFPLPVTKAGSRTRIARTSGYIEVIAPLAQVSTAGVLSDFIFPATLSSSGTPATLVAPHLNLEKLPILHVKNKDRIQWLCSLTSGMFSLRERQMREEADSVTGISGSVRVNFKESLFMMFMLAAGLQGGQTGMFSIDHSEKGGIHMLIFVSAIRLDGATSSAVLDAAVLPLTHELIRSGKIESFLLLIRELECCSLTMDDAELTLWKKCLPGLAERCRTWPHGPDCEYKKAHATIPLSLELGEQLLCSCGNGKLPENFIAVPDWDLAAPHAVRVAISPTFAVPYVEDIVNSQFYNQVKPVVSAEDTCRNCGKTTEMAGASLKKCLRCSRVKYCSRECQKKDWKKHRMECESEDSD